jgi:hypothetical protein
MYNKSFSNISFIKNFSAFALASAVVVSNSSSARAVQFNFSYAPGTTLEQAIGMEMAGGIWANHLKDNVAINFYVQTANDLPSTVIGGALPGLEAQYKYKYFHSSFSSDATSLDDVVAVGNLPKKDDKKNDKYTLRFSGNGKNDEVKDIQTINLTRANAKALGIVSNNDSALDGVVVMNTLAGKPVSWNYDFTGNIQSNQFDYLSVAVHEMGHNLGFISGADDPGLISVVTENAEQDKPQEIKGDKMEYVNILDLFRYSTASTLNGLPDISINGDDKYFSINKGLTSLADFATGKTTSLGGDGYQASHWKQQDNPVGIMDPVVRAGQIRSISNLDRRAMDILGWDLQPANIDLATLQIQAKQRLAARIGVTVAWLEANPIQAAQLLAQDRDRDVEMMIENSKIYEWGSSSGSGSGSGRNCNNQGQNGWNSSGCRWQDAFFANGYWQSSESSSTKVPEPSAIIGLLGLLGLGFILKLKR